MSRRKTFEISGVGHGNAPIPMAAQVGSVLRSSGIPPTDVTTGEMPESGVDQVKCAFENTATLLEAAGMSPGDVVYMGVALADNDLRAAVNEHWLAWYPDPHDRPARHITVAPLPFGMLAQLQIEAIGEEAT